VKRKLLFLPWQLAVAYVLDLMLGDPRFFPHPVRWIGHLVSWTEGVFYDGSASSALQRLAGLFFWSTVVAIVAGGTVVIVGAFSHLHPLSGRIIAIWLAFSTLATRNLHQESGKVALAVRQGNLDLARKRLAFIVSRDTTQMEEKDIVRALVETVSENISDGIVAPLFYLSVGGLCGGLIYKAVNTMDSMVGYMNARYRHFGWFAAKADDVANWVPARLSGILIVLAAVCLRLSWLGAWRTLLRDARKMKSPNAGYPEAAAAGALGVQVGGTNVYFGKAVAKPLLGDPINALTIDVYRPMIRLMYITSLLAFALSLITMYLISRA
jgi:adenosylcobinamide-phosphate synthase